MGLIDNKRNVFTMLGSYSSFMEQENMLNPRDSFTSINNKNEIIPFLLDTLKVVAGTEALKQLVGELILEISNKSEIKLKTALKKQFIQSNAGDPIPIEFKTNGYTIPVKKIDLNGKFFSNPLSEEGNLIFDNQVPNFDSVVHNSISNAGTSYNFSGLEIKYIESTDSLNFKVPTGSNMKIGEFFAEFIDNTQIINKNELQTNVLDIIFGTLSKDGGKTEQQVLNKLESQFLIKKIMNGDDSFVILPEERAGLTEIATNLSNGENRLNLGCGLMSTVLEFSELKNLISTVSGSTNSFEISSSYEDTMMSSVSNNPEVAVENKETIRDGFFQMLIDLFTVELIGAVTTSPQIRTLLAIISGFQNNSEIALNDKAVDDFKKHKIFIKCLIKEALSLIAEFIFNLVVSYMIKLLTPVIKRVLREKINQYVKILKSLSPFKT